MTNDAATPALTVKDLDVWYGPAQAVFGLSVSVAKGETVGLLGRNGAGKTSSILGILGQGVRRRGRIMLDGIDVSHLPTHRIARAGLAWVPDSRRLFPTLTVAENLDLARTAVRGGETLSNAEIIDIFPLIAKIINRRGGLLSGGEQQIVAIARALVPRAKVVLVDEPTEGLAPVIVQEVVEALLRMRSELGQALLLAEANTGVIEQVAHRVTVLSVGHPVYAGTVQDFAKEQEVQQRYLSLGVA
jgi:branched-chain amino acid transport system ATP-binding protein